MVGGGQIQQHQQQVQQHQQMPFTHQPQIQNVYATPIVTPANNPQTFQSNQLPPSNSNEANTRAAPQLGQGVAGVDLLSRILMGLKSGIQSEEDWALAALMQVSFNSPQAIDLRIQNTLANTVLKRVHSRCLEANERTNESTEKDVANPLDVPTLTGKTLKEQQKVLEALLVLRNTSLDPENAQFLAKSEMCRYIIIHGLSLPDLRVYSEFKHLCLEITEAISVHVTLSSAQDKLFLSVVDALNTGSSDRSIIIPALRSLARMLIHDEHDSTKSLTPEFVDQILRFLLISDDELITATLDFVYQYTRNEDNMRSLLHNFHDTELVTKHLVRLLTFGMNKPHQDYSRLPRLTPRVIPLGPPPIPAEILDKMLKLPEPDRATLWMQSSYEYDVSGEVTQISLWKAYEAQFEAHSRAPSATPASRLLPAVDFIKNVTTAFQNSAAMVVNLADGQKKFIIKGIIPRQFAIDPTTLPSHQAASSGALLQKKSAQKGPPAFGVTVALVLENIAKSSEGKQLLRPLFREIIDAGLVNHNVQLYVQEIMELLDSPADKDNADEDD